MVFEMSTHPPIPLANVEKTNKNVLANIKSKLTEVSKQTMLLYYSVVGAAAVRAASRLADESISSPKLEKKVKITPTSQNKRKHTEDSDDEPSGSGTPVPSLKKRSTSISSTASSAKNESVPPLKKTKSEPPREYAVKVFGRLMEGVVFAMSGFQNPYRAKLR
ncbi:DNA repair protein XRCC1-like [Mytilus edulis]|uniref:DNA repair protein XRCC1-like n=1 Tax=Mytilus edulis TaxID=6550 RepID=UPI0039F12EEE